MFDTIQFPAQLPAVPCNEASASLFLSFLLAPSPPARDRALYGKVRVPSIHYRQTSVSFRVSSESEIREGYEICARILSANALHDALR